MQLRISRHQVCHILNEAATFVYKTRSMNPLIECVPNFSEGRDHQILEAIADSIRGVEGVNLLDIDPGKATNRTVMTFVGHPEVVIEAAYQAIKRASELIDMSKHQGEHPRMGATDVCPLIPISDITMDEVVTYARRLGKRVGDELDIPGYYYEYAATSPERKNLATVRAGEYEGLEDRITTEAWKPDFGRAIFHKTAGATAISARDFLIAYNVNLNTTSVRRANSIAFDVREKGRIKREGGRLDGAILRNQNGDPIRKPGICKSVKAIGWYIEEYGLAQISMNLTNMHDTSIHQAFEACRQSANQRGLRVTGSELVGLIPKQAMIDAGKYYLKAQQRSVGLSDEEIIRIAVVSMGLNELSEFDIQKKVIEYAMTDAADQPLIRMSTKNFADETASESPAPGGGSISAYVGALGASLATMVANLSAHKRGWDDRWESFSEWAEQGMTLQKRLLLLVDEDTQAFKGIMHAIRMPQGTDDEKSKRTDALVAATKNAIEVPQRIAETSLSVCELARDMIEHGNPNSLSDAGVAVLCARAAVHGAYMNMLINTEGLNDTHYVNNKLQLGQRLVEQVDEWEKILTNRVYQKLNS